MREIKIPYATQKRTDNLEKYLIQLIDDGKPTLLDQSVNYRAFITYNGSLVTPTGIELTIQDNQLVLDSAKLDFPAGIYRFEIWAEKDGQRAIYPDTGMKRLVINANATDLPNGTVTSLTLDEFIEQFKEAIKGIEGQGPNADISIDVAKRTITINGKSLTIPEPVDLGGLASKDDIAGLVKQTELAEYVKKNDLPKITLDTEKRIITINGKSITIPDNVNLDSVKTNAYPVSEGESPSATLAKTQDGTYVISFGVPQGATGPAGHDGKNGSDGTTPHVDTATGDWFLGDKDTGVHAQGEQGKTGQTGKDGITPHIDKTTGNWFIGDNDTGIHAQGATGDTGQNGKNGVTPHIGDNGDWFIGDQDTNLPSRGVQGPQGEPGKDGQQGVPGASGKDGDTPYIGSNGHWYVGSRDTGKPSQGRAGTDGKSPIRGTDYWTDADKAEIKKWVDDAILNGKW